MHMLLFLWTPLLPPSSSSCATITGSPTACPTGSRPSAAPSAAGCARAAGCRPPSRRSATPARGARRRPRSPRAARRAASLFVFVDWPLGAIRRVLGGQGADERAALNVQHDTITTTTCVGPGPKPPSRFFHRNPPPKQQRTHEVDHVVGQHAAAPANTAIAAADSLPHALHVVGVVGVRRLGARAALPRGARRCLVRVKRALLARVCRVGQRVRGALRGVDGAPARVARAVVAAAVGARRGGARGRRPGDGRVAGGRLRVKRSLVGVAVDVGGRHRRGADVVAVAAAAAVLAGAAAAAERALVKGDRHRRHRSGRRSRGAHQVASKRSRRCRRHARRQHILLLPRQTREEEL